MAAETARVLGSWRLWQFAVCLWRRETVGTASVLDFSNLQEQSDDGIVQEVVRRICFIKSSHHIEAASGTCVFAGLQRGIQPQGASMQCGSVKITVVTLQ